MQKTNRECLSMRNIEVHSILSTGMMEESMVYQHCMTVKDVWGDHLKSVKGELSKLGLDKTNFALKANTMGASLFGSK